MEGQLGATDEDRDSLMPRIERAKPIRRRIPQHTALPKSVLEMYLGMKGVPGPKPKRLAPRPTIYTRTYGREEGTTNE